MDMAQSTFDHAPGRRSAVLPQQVLLQRTGVDADANRNFSIGGDFHHFFHIPARADIAGIETQTVDSLLNRDQRQLVIKMNVRN